MTNFEESPCPEQAQTEPPPIELAASESHICSGPAQFAGRQLGCPSQSNSHDVQQEPSEIPVEFCVQHEQAEYLVLHKPLQPLGETIWL
mmetsp:Transcript_83027/g.211308  ORF Transcript_83027/g.211308 Transcript_83027/m.211308 type:complete len:89 (+) Transcript_83027:155-421(+)